MLWLILAFRQLNRKNGLAYSLYPNSVNRQRNRSLDKSSYHFLRGETIYAIPLLRPMENVLMCEGVKTFADLLEVR